MLPKKIHIIGAGGVGMSGLALLAARMGAQVSASDQNDSPYLKKLAEQGMTVWTGSEPSRLERDRHIYYSSAIKAGDPERSHAERSGFPCEPRHELLKIITQEYFTIAIAGCHGKTTTSAWIADLLTRAGADPTALIGGTVPEWNSNYREGKGQRNGKPILVIEADESDRSFLSIQSSVALTTNIDLDHTDVHASLENLERDFLDFSRTAQDNGGWIQVSLECGGSLLRSLAPEDIAIRNEISVQAGKQAVGFSGKEFPVGLAGVHNLMNATLVLQFAIRWKIPEHVIAESLARFSGVNRRMQRLAEFAEWNLAVIDDYAHHPHEVQATLEALASQYERLLIFWEPHRLSRFTYFHKEFATVLGAYAAKHTLYSLPLYASGDNAGDYPEAQELFQYFVKSPFRHIGSRADFNFGELNLDGRKTAAVFMGAGSSSEYAHAFVTFLEIRRAASRLRRPDT